MSELPFVEAPLNGFFPPDHDVEGRVTLDLTVPPDPDADMGTRPMRIRDARALQTGRNEAAFFSDHGFALLDHTTAVADWDLQVDPTTPFPEHPILQVYAPEIEELIRTRLLPGRKIEMFQTPPVRRGPGTENPDYAMGIHQDFGISPDDYQETMVAFTTPEIGAWWRSRYDQDDVAGFMVINFWRPVCMEGPVEHMPLAVCEPGSVPFEDLVPLGVLGLTPTGKPTNQLSSRANPEQRWYYYPRMTTGEVLAFTNFGCTKDDPRRVGGCFHTAFEHPDTPADAETRQSCEHRVNLFLLRD